MKNIHSLFSSFWSSFPTALPLSHPSFFFALLAIQSYDRNILSVPLSNSQQDHNHNKDYQFTVVHVNGTCDLISTFFFTFITFQICRPIIFTIFLRQAYLSIWREWKILRNLTIHFDFLRIPHFNLTSHTSNMKGRKLHHCIIMKYDVRSAFSKCILKYDRTLVYCISMV